MNIKMNLFWVAVLGIGMGAATQRTLAGSEKTADFEAERRQVEKEDAEEEAERVKGIRHKRQRVFLGTVYLLARPDPELSADVVGHFLTSLRDKKPNRRYLLKLGGVDSKGLADALKKLDRKPATLIGNLRVIGEDGEAKYLIVDSTMEEGATPKVPERRSVSGL